jgi:hypothetical protein
MQDVSNVTVEDFFAIVGMTLFVVGCVIVWSLRGYWLPAAAAIWRVLRTVARALYPLISAAAGDVADAAERRRTARAAYAPHAPVRTRVQTTQASMKTSHAVRRMRACVRTRENQREVSILHPTS